MQHCFASEVEIKTLSVKLTLLHFDRKYSTGKYTISKCVFVFHIVHLTTSLVLREYFSIKLKNFQVSKNECFIIFLVMSRNVELTKMQ